MPIGCILLLLLCIIYVLGKVDGWFFFLTPWEVAVSLSHHVLLALFEGIIAGTIAFLCCLLVLFLTPSDARKGIADFLRSAALVFAASLTIFLLLGLLASWMKAVGLSLIPSSVVKMATIALAIALAFGAFWPGSRASVNRRLANKFASSGSRRIVLMSGAAAAGIATLDAITREALPEPTQAPARARAPNILLVTFDSLSAEDMSLYGYRRPTTPNIDKFASTATCFNKFFSCSTFTTPSVASMLTGCYPSTTKIHDLRGSFHGSARSRSLLAVLHHAGYQVSASVGNPYAHPRRLGLAGDFVLTERPLFQRNPLSRAVVDATDDPVLFDFAFNQENNILGRSDKFLRRESAYPPEMAFAKAEDMLNALGSERPWFLWVHLFAPHFPYLPSPPYLRRFLPTDELLRAADFSLPEPLPHLKPWERSYPESLQPSVDKARLRYNEFIAECDAAFGAFMTRIHSAGKLDNTAVLFSADHGESFTGGVAMHNCPQQMRSVLHIPLIVRLPDADGVSLVDMALDQTVLAPTILDIAGIPVPSWMEGRSVLPEMLAPTGRTGFAFSQFLSRSSIFAPVQDGVVSVTDGSHQYVVDIQTGRGGLRPLSEANNPAADHSAQQPELAGLLRRTIMARFPDLTLPDA